MARMKAPESGVTVRMYRQGQGDCFLLAFPREGGGEPVYVMIDCGYMGGSQIERSGKKITTTRVAKDIEAATDNRLDVVIVTHEHADHVNGLKKFKNFEIGAAWFAWTEDPNDARANELRRRHDDQLLGLVEARNQLALAADDDAAAGSAVTRLDRLLTLELGAPDDPDENGDVDDDDPGLPVGMEGFATAGDPTRSRNKTAMKAIKDAAGGRLSFLRPHGDIHGFPAVAGVRVFSLGPPRDEDLLRDEDPKGDEAFPGHSLAGAGALSFFAAAKQGASGHGAAPFDITYGLSTEKAFADKDYGGFFSRHYGAGDDADAPKGLAPDNAKWRRIDHEWLYAAESFALKLNRGINNTSLVLAIELPRTKKVLLFAADAQRGNWKSWDDGTWSDGDTEIACRDLLSRTVLYKVGHHGSHNATLKGEDDSGWPNLSWMATAGQNYADEFTAMITAHRDWAVSKQGWDHPLPAIRKALEAKASGRVFQIDREMPSRPGTVLDANWRRFESRVEITDCYIEYRVPDEF